MLLPTPRVRAATWLAAVLALCGAAACADPPTKEIDQAQAAIEVAVSGGADHFAAADLAAARTALVQARDAVAQRDYKSALGHALDSRERAQTAARHAAEGRDALKRETQAALAEVMALEARAQRLVATAAPGTPRVRARRARPVLARLTTRVQEARTLVEGGDDLKASAALPALKAEILKVIDEVEGSGAAQSSRKAR